MAMAEQPDVKRPPHRTVSMWTDLQNALHNITAVEFILGLHREKPRDGIDWDAVEVQLQDARATLGALALALSEEADS